MLHGILYRIFTLGLSYLGFQQLKTESHTAAVIPAAATGGHKTTDDGIIADTNGNLENCRRNQRYGSSDCWAVGDRCW